MTPLPAALALAAAVAAGPTPPPPSFDLRCERTPAVRCEWDAQDGAESYRVIRVARRAHHHPVVRTRRTTETSFTQQRIRPGRYVYVVIALDADGERIGRSDRARVVVPRAD
jgi:hypothetical protein